MKTLIVYFSWSNGNTKRIAEMLQKKTGADIERIETAVPYPEDHNTTVMQGQKEVEEGFMPVLKPMKHDISQYDRIIVGTPTWWYTMSPAIHTFLHDHDFTGKTVVPFMTNGGWPGTVIKDMENAAKGASFRHAKEIRFDSQGKDHMITPLKEVETWIEEVAED